MKFRYKVKDRLGKFEAAVSIDNQIIHWTDEYNTEQEATRAAQFYLRQLHDATARYRRCKPVAETKETCNV